MQRVALRVALLVVQLVALLVAYLVASMVDYLVASRAYPTVDMKVQELENL